MFRLKLISLPVYQCTRQCTNKYLFMYENFAKDNLADFFKTWLNMCEKESSISYCIFYNSNVECVFRITPSEVEGDRTGEYSLILTISSTRQPPNLALCRRLVSPNLQICNFQSRALSNSISIQTWPRHVFFCLQRLSGKLVAAK